MLEQLLNLVKEQAQGAIVNNDAVPNEHNEAAIQDITNTIQSTLSGEAGGGNLSSVMDMFKGQGGDITQNPMVQNIINNAAGSLSEKFGVDQNQAVSIANSLIPQIMNRFTSQTADPNDSTFDLNSVISSFTGGNTNTSGIGGLINNFFK